MTWVAWLVLVVGYLAGGLGIGSMFVEYRVWRGLNRPNDGVLIVASGVVVLFWPFFLLVLGLGWLAKRIYEHDERARANRGEGGRKISTPS